MAYDPDAHQRLEALSEKYRDWYMAEARYKHDPGRLVLNADGQESSLAECYEDAMVTAHALYVYLVEHLSHGGLHEDAGAFNQTMLDFLGRHSM